jgi:microcystin-dependent protein
MAGTISISMTQQFDVHGRPLSGGKLHFYQAGTTSTPQNAYKDLALTLPHPNPIELNSAGRVPQLFLADGYIKIALVDSHGVEQEETDFVLVVGPSSGEGSGPSVDATTILATGDIRLRYGTGVLTGSVRANGRTIGSATSGANERANADCQPLFLYLWNTDANLSVSTGRGASASADWTANKTIALPDMRGRAPYGADDMGSSPANRLTSGYFGSDATILGHAGGLEYHLLTVSELPAAPPAHGDTTINLNVVHPMQGSVDGGTSNPTLFRWSNNTTVETFLNLAAEGTVTVTGNLGGGSAHAVVSPGIIMTFYIKL